MFRPFNKESGDTLTGS